MKSEKPNLRQGGRNLQSYVDAVAQRLKHPIHTAGFDPEVVASDIERRATHLEQENARRAGAYWAANFATVHELALLEQLVIAQLIDDVGWVRTFVESYEEHLRDECEDAPVPEPYVLHAVMRLMVTKVAEGNAEMTRSFARGALEVWTAVKGNVFWDTVEAPEVGKAS